MNELTLTTEHEFKSPPKAVFNAWLDPEMLKSFMLPGAGMSVPSASCDANPGGRFSIVMQADGNEMPHRGTYTEISPHERLVFTWESPFSIEGSEVTLTFAAKGEGTHLTLTHVRFPDQDSRDNHLGGWVNILTKLDEVLQTEDAS